MVSVWMFVLRWVAWMWRLANGAWRKRRCMGTGLMVGGVSEFGLMWFG